MEEKRGGVAPQAFVKTRVASQNSFAKFVAIEELVAIPFQTILLLRLVYDPFCVHHSNAAIHDLRCLGNKLDEGFFDVAVCLLLLVFANIPRTICHV